MHRVCLRNAENIVRCLRYVHISNIIFVRLTIAIDQLEEGPNCPKLLHDSHIMWTDHSLTRAFRSIALVPALITYQKNSWEFSVIFLPVDESAQTTTPQAPAGCIIHSFMLPHILARTGREKASGIPTPFDSGPPCIQQGICGAAGECEREP